MSQFNLSDAPNLWPNLKDLGILSSYHGYYSTLNTIKLIAPHLHEFQHLEQLCVPQPPLVGVQSSPFLVLAQAGYPIPGELRVKTLGEIYNYRSL